MQRCVRKVVVVLFRLAISLKPGKVGMSVQNWVTKSSMSLKFALKTVMYKVAKTVFFRTS